MSEMEKDNFAQAVEELRLAAEMKPDDVVYQRDWLQSREKATNKLIARADAAKAAGRLDDARSIYATILKYDPANARARIGLDDLTDITRALGDVEQGRVALKQGDLDRAQRQVARALDRVPNLALARALRRDIDEALPPGPLSLPGLAGLYKKPINLEFRDASVRTVFDALSRTTSINFIFDRDVKPDARTTVFLKQTPLEDAIDVILATNQLEKKVLNATSVLIYPNTPQKLKEYQDLLVKAFYLSNVDAKTAANLLKSVLKIKDVYVDEKYHMIVLRENADTIALAEKLIALQDLEEPEVMLEVEVLEVNRNRLLNLGIQVTDQLTVSPLNANSLSGSTTANNGTTSPTYKLSDLLHLNSDKLGVTVPSVTVSLQKADGDANLLANPRMRVRDREKAKILIGDKVPVVTTTTTPNGFLSENIQYLEVGLKLDVEPEIFVHDEVALKLGLEVSSLVGSVKTATGSQAYQIGTRNINTALRLRDGETQVLAGLISDADRSNANRIPLLGDVPLLGRLFSSQKDDRQKTEIVMSITPHLIRNIQRKAPVAESFWSGTEATLRTRTIQLGVVGQSSGATAASSALSAHPSAAVATPATAAIDMSGLQLQLSAPDKVKLGQVFAVEVKLDSKHTLRAAPLQLAYNPAAYEVISVQAGDYFSRGGSLQFSHVVDKQSGRISIGLSTSDAKGLAGGGGLVKVELKPLSANVEGDIAVIALTPVGSAQAVSAPTLPQSAHVVIE
ncbi:cohesin domain-containing protein [Duganella qianjiadongensis]|uniref:General secretion pathway protein GspD n=1 Tax=Duganella qianjiadongensis TaxID=2692176 RepID=A0ABW9VNP2_9BURK|nr:cohesin domain-containing protein [Duganella qianjiadongensis]MYM41179.1 general secretion pathway protein GspD [Duganella qianjiadongensis]